MRVSPFFLTISSMPSSGIVKARAQPPASARLHREHGPPAHHTRSGLARHPRDGGMNVIELLADLQAQHDEATARAGELRGQIEHLTATLAETEARLADLATTRKVIAEAAPAGAEPDPPETNTAYQAIVHAFNQHRDACEQGWAERGLGLGSVRAGQR
jgi:hypothetical protein